MRLIDADALIGDLHNHAFLEGDDRTITYNIIQKQPTVNGWINEMSDRDIAIKGLENLWCCISPVSYSCEDCPERGNHVECKRRVIEKAITILQEQEVIKQEAYENGFHDGYRQAMHEVNPCENCQEWECDDCKFARR